MALYLVIHTPRADDQETVYPPTDLAGLAAFTGPARWVRAYSPDLHDDRQFTLWEADSAAQIEAAMERFLFMPDREASILRVHAWGPEEVDAMTRP